MIMMLTHNVSQSLQSNLVASYMCRYCISKYTYSFSITEIRLYRHLVVKICVFKVCGDDKILCYLYCHVTFMYCSNCFPDTHKIKTKNPQGLKLQYFVLL